MKNLLLLFAILIGTIGFAQDKAKTDKLYLNDGSTLEVKVAKVADGTVEFTYPGETVVNTEKTTNIRTIVFSSGRVQQFNTGPATTSASQPVTTMQQTQVAEHRAVKANELAILPVTFIDKVSGEMSEDNSKLAQARIYDFLQDDMSKISPLTLQDTRNTNSYLRKANIGYRELDEIAIEELQQILGAEYLAISRVTFEVKNKLNSNESTWGSSEKKGNKDRGSVHSSSTISEDKSYTFVVVLEIYKGKEKIYNETRTPFFNMADSWKDAYEYMLKRTPIYKRK